MRLLLICLFFLLPLPALAGSKVALVIGVSDYKSISPLKNTVNDANALSAVLNDIGFDVTTLINANGGDMRKALETFAFETETADLALIYFAGHGVEVQGENFLIPADAAVTSNADIQKEALSLDDLLAAVDHARKMRIVILDSCRDNPFGDVIDLSNSTQSSTSDTATRGVGGMAPPVPDRGTLVAFAAKDGNVAMDGNGSNSPFALALMDKMQQEGLEISLMFRQVRDDVLSRTANRQEPHTYGSLSGIPFFLAGAGDLPNQINALDPKIAWSALRPEDEAQFIALAETGDTRSLMNLAYMRLNPHDERFDLAVATDYIERAAKAGSPEAQYELAVQFETGKGVKQDSTRALELYRQAATQNYPDALNDLGFFYYQGMLGLPTDPKTALVYFERAADQRHPQAMYNFAALIDDGLVPGKTPEDAAGYIYQALRAGSSSVLRVLTENPDQLKQATRRALQARLSEYAFYDGTIDGDFGPGTKRGIRRAYGLTD